MHRFAAIVVLALCAATTAQADIIWTKTGTLEGIVTGVDSFNIHVRVADGSTRLILRKDFISVEPSPVEPRSTDTLGLPMMHAQESQSLGYRLPVSESQQPLDSYLVLAAGTKLNSAGCLMGAGWAASVVGGVLYVLLNNDVNSPNEIRIGVPVLFGLTTIGLNIAAIVNLADAGTTLKDATRPQRRW